MALTVNLTKSAGALRLSLQKLGIVTPPQAELAFCMDVSGSFDDEHRDGLTQLLLERLTPWGVLFDPDKKLDVFTFSNGPKNVHHVGDLTEANLDGYVRKQIIDRVPGYNGGTDYSYVLKRCLQHFGWINQDQAAAAAPAPVKKSWWGFASKPAATVIGQAPVTQKKRSIVIFVTDGASDDESKTEALLAESEARKDEVYFLFIGVSNQGGSFPFLKKIGDRFSNTGLVVIRNLPAWVKKTDDEINAELIGEELIAWLKKS